jgi:hypothetical protein
LKAIPSSSRFSSLRAFIAGTPHTDVNSTNNDTILNNTSHGESMMLDQRKWDLGIKLQAPSPYFIYCGNFGVPAADTAVVLVPDEVDQSA